MSTDNVGNTSSFTRSNEGAASTSGYYFLEPAHLGPYTLQVWRVPTDLTLDKTPSPTRVTKTKVRFTSYLPRGTHGVRLPVFTATLRSPTKCNDVTNIAPPLTQSPERVKPKIAHNLHSFSEAPEMLRHDPSFYCSPFTSARSNSVGSPPTSTTLSAPVIPSISTYSAPSSSSSLTPPASPQAQVRFPGRHTTPSFMWQLSLYLDGNTVDPTEIPDFIHFPWAQDQRGSWSSRFFTKEELSAVLQDIITTVDPSAEISAAEILQKELASKASLQGRVNSDNWNSPIQRHSDQDVNLLL